MAGTEGFDKSCRNPTSSLLDCFCLLALMVDPAASLWTVDMALWVCASKAGRGTGIFDAGLLNAGKFPRLPCRLGVPRIVPLVAILRVWMWWTYATATSVVV